MYAFIDSDGNGYVSYRELILALVILCRASIESKISHSISVFSANEQGLTCQEMNSFLQFVYRLSLDTHNEMLLDYDIE
jgi:hypothetical protein